MRHKGCTLIRLVSNLGLNTCQRHFTLASQVRNARFSWNLTIARLATDFEFTRAKKKLTLAMAVIKCTPAIATANAMMKDQHEVTRTCVYIRT